MRVRQSVSCAIVLVILAVGCGGGGAGSKSALAGAAVNSNSNSGNSNLDPTPASATSTLFHVDVPSGKVTIVPSQSVSRAIFSGTSVSFNSSLLVDQPGDPSNSVGFGVKALSVTMTNNWSLPIGQLPNGTATNINVIFSPISNVTGLSELGAQTSVTTFAGNGTAGFVNGPVGSSEFSGPTGVAVLNGVTYVADRNSCRIRKIQSGNVTTLAGSGVVAEKDGLAGAAQFAGPYGMAVNPVDGSLIVSDISGNTIRRVTTDGHVTTVAGTGAAGGTDGAGNAATFNTPAGLTVDPSGNIYVVEQLGQRVREISLTGGNPASSASYTTHTVAGSGTAGWTDATGTSATFNAPVGIAIDPSGNLYVSEQGNNTVRRITTAHEVTTIAGTGPNNASSTDGAGNVATFDSPRGISYVNGALFVCDRAGNKIRQVSLSNASGSPASSASYTVVTLAGTGTSGDANGLGNAATFNQPQMVTADASGTLYVTDVNNQVRLVTPNTGVFPIGIPSASSVTEPVQLSNPTGTVPSTGVGTNLPFITYPGPLAAGATSPAVQWSFVVPTGVTAFEFTVTVEADTNLFEPAGGSTNVGSSDVVVRTLAGSPTYGFSDGNGAQARFYGIAATAIDAQGNIYVGDVDNSAIRRITPAGVVTTVAGGPGLVAQTLGETDGYGNVATINAPTAIAVTPDGSTVYFMDDTYAFSYLRVAKAYGDPSNQGNWYVTSLSSSTTQSLKDGPVAQATFNGSYGLALSPSGDLYASELYGNRIRRVRYLGGSVSSSTSWYTSTIAGDTSQWIGQAGSVNGFGSSARFSQPRGLAFDQSGNLYVADASDCLIRKITPNSSVSTYAGSSTGYADGAASSAKFYAPCGVTVDSTGAVYVADAGNSVIRRISPGGIVTTVAGVQGEQADVDGTGATSNFFNPTDVQVLPDGDIYVSDYFAIRLIEPVVTNGSASTASAVKKKRS